MPPKVHAHTVQKVVKIDQKDNRANVVIGGKAKTQNRKDKQITKKEEISKGFLRSPPQ